MKIGRKFLMTMVLIVIGIGSLFIDTITWQQVALILVPGLCFLFVEGTLDLKGIDIKLGNISIDSDSKDEGQTGE